MFDRNGFMSWLEDTLQNLKELRDESALYSTSNLMRELQIIRNGYVKGE